MEPFTVHYLTLRDRTPHYPTLDYTAAQLLLIHGAFHRAVHKAEREPRSRAAFKRAGACHVDGWKDATWTVRVGSLRATCHVSGGEGSQGWAHDLTHSLGAADAGALINKTIRRD